MNSLKVAIPRYEHELSRNIYLKLEIQFDPEKSYMIKINVIIENSSLPSFLLSTLSNYSLWVQRIIIAPDLSHTHTHSVGRL